MIRSRFAARQQRAIAALAISFATFYLLTWASELCAEAQYDPMYPPEHSSTSIQFPDGQIVTAELSCRPRELARGLMNRAELPADHGMLFIYQKPGLHQHWMWHCRFPLDLLWIDAHHLIREVFANVPPCNSLARSGCRLYGDVSDAVYVLEIAAGASNEHGLKVGDQVSFDTAHASKPRW